MIKRFARVILAAVCALAMMPVPALAFEASALTVVVKYGSVYIQGIDVAVCRVADLQENGTGYQAVPAFSGAGVEFRGLTTTEAVIAIAKSLDAYTAANRIQQVSKPTNAQGGAVFEGLAAGLYLVTQGNPQDSGYVMAPYLAAVPTRTRTAGGWDYNVTTFPKIEPRMLVQPGNVISVSVYKVWVGAGAHPGSALVQLYRNGMVYGNCVTLGAGNDWSHIWTGLDPKAAWTVDEVDIPAGYTKSISGSVAGGFVVTNTRDAQAAETTLVSGQKTWKHGVNPPGERPQAITVMIKANGTAILHRRITAAEHWSWSFRLPRYNAQGAEIKYTVAEEQITDYAGAVDGYNLINTYNPVSGVVIPGTERPLVLPQTNDENNPVLWLTLMGVSALCLAAVIIILRRRERNEKKCS